jgi:hypothetical protein
MVKIDNEFLVKAQPLEVWDVITQVEKYEDWNSFVSKCETSLVVGEPIKMKVHLLPFPISQKETILEYEPGVILNYGITLPLNLLKSTRKHTVEKIDEDQVRYRSEFRLEGIISPLVALLMEGMLNQGFTRMAEEMRAEVLRRQN